MLEEQTPLVGLELVVHLFAPTDGPRAAECYAYLNQVWYRCRHGFGMRRPIRGLDVPDTPPPRQHHPEPTNLRAPIAAQGRPGAGVFQSLLRREHDVLCLSVMMAPPPNKMIGWTQLADWWARASRPPPTCLLGTAELYLAKLADRRSQRVEPTVALGEACRRLLPFLPRPDFNGRGASTADGFAVWEAEKDDEARSRRRIVVVAPHHRDAELSSWTWTRGGAAGMTVSPFAKYLLHAAKLRYHLRVWAGGAPVRALRRDADEVVAAVAATLHDTAYDGASSPPHAGEQQLATLRREAYSLARATTHLREMRRCIDASASNMAGYAPTTGERPLPAATTGHDVFTDDRGLATWFTAQLEDDHFYLATALDRVRAALDAADTTGTRTGGTLRRPEPSAPAGPDGQDVALSSSERAEVLLELSTVFTTDGDAERLLSALGFARARRPSLDAIPPRTGWAMILNECDHGAVATPYRRLVAGVLRLYPHNLVFKTLAERHGVETTGP